MCAFLRGWTPAQAEEHAELLAQIATNFGVFQVAGEACYVPELFDRVPEGGSAETQSMAAGAGQGMCLVSGERAKIARLHEPKIKGVAGAQSAGGAAGFVQREFVRVVWQVAELQRAGGGRDGVFAMPMR